MNRAVVLALTQLSRNVTPARTFYVTSGTFTQGGKVKTKNVLSFDSLFPAEISADVVVERRLDDALDSKDREKSIASSKDGEDVGETFGSLASPETKRKLRELEELWPISGWNDGLEDELGAETSEKIKLDTGLSVLTKSADLLVTSHAPQEEDEVYKPSLLFPGDSFERAVRRGERTSVTIRDEDGEPRDHLYYQSKIDKLINRGYVREALQLYEVGMKLEDRKEPDFHLYNSLLKACSMIGDVNRASTIYRRMRERGDSLTAHTFVHLFNSCHRCQSLDKGLKMAEGVWRDLKEDDFHFTGKDRKRGIRTAYNLFMKVLLKNGLIHRIFELYDEMDAKGIAPDYYTPVLLLQACSHDKTDGFAKALLFWKDFRCRFPNADITVAHYEHLIKAALNGGVGRPELFMPLLLPGRDDGDGVLSTETIAYLERLGLPKSVETPLRLDFEKGTSKLARLTGGDSSTPTRSGVLEERGTSLNSDFLSDGYRSAPTASMVAVPGTSLPASAKNHASDQTDQVGLTNPDLSTPHGRLSLIGGPEKIVKRMMQSVKKTPTTGMIFVPLLRCAGGDVDETIKSSLKLMDEAGVRPDEHWINSAISHVMEAKRGDERLKGAWKLIRVAESRGISLTPRVFENIAYYITTPRAFEEFTAALKAANVEPTVETFEILISKNKMNNDLMRRVFNAATEEFLVPLSPRFRRKLEKNLEFYAERSKELAKEYEKWLLRNDKVWGE